MPFDATVARVDPRTDEIFAWVWDLELPLPADARDCLDADERQRAQRFVFDRDRQRYIAAHWGLRRILSGCTGVHPADIVFGIGSHGKPFLAENAGDEDIRFSLSHSANLAFLAVTCGREIGADIEQVRPIHEGIAERFFAPEEVASLTSLPHAKQTAGFYRIWSCKEAILKATGLGLSMPLDSFAVTVDGPPAVVRMTEEHGKADQWDLNILCLAHGFHAAIALAPVEAGRPLRALKSD